MRPDEILYSPKDLTAIVDMSYRQVQYWDRTGLLRPAEKTDGRYRSYSFSDVLEAEVIIRLREDYRLSIQRLRKISPSLKEEFSNHREELLELSIAIPNVRSREPVIMIAKGRISRSRPDGKDFFYYSASDLARSIRENPNLTVSTRKRLME